MTRSIVPNYLSRFAPPPPPISRSLTLSSPLNRLVTKLASTALH